MTPDAFTSKLTREQARQARGELRAENRRELVKVAESLGIVGAASMKFGKLRTLTTNCIGRTPEQVAKLTKKRTATRAARHVAKSGELTFDRHQFEKHSVGDYEALMSYRCNSVAGESGFDPDELGGMSVREITPRRQAAPWARDEAQVEALLRQVFPQVYVEGKPTRLRSGFYSCSDWRYVIDLYFATGWDVPSIVEAWNRAGGRMGNDGIVTAKYVENVVQSIKRRRAGLSAKGKPLKGGRGGRRTGAGRIKGQYSTKQAIGTDTSAAPKQKQTIEATEAQRNEHVES